MDRDDIIRMASEAGFLFDTVSKLQLRPFYIAQPIELEHFANLVAAAEREACANVCDSYDVADDVCSSDTAEGIAIAIRARGQG
jgi:hypothetical protein